MAVSQLRTISTARLTNAELVELRAFLDEAFGGRFSDEDWAHTLGGDHVLVADPQIICHAAVVPRLLKAGEQNLRTGYVEGVATAAGRRGRGHAASVMREINALIRTSYEMGALSTEEVDFYGRLGWEVWRGPTYAHTADGRRRTSEEDGGVMVLRTPATHALDLELPLVCDWRLGDLW